MLIYNLHEQRCNLMELQAKFANYESSEMAEGYLLVLRFEPCPGVSSRQYANPAMKFGWICTQRTRIF